MGGYRIRGIDKKPEAGLPIHRHHGGSETVAILRGKIHWIFYDDNGNDTERVVLDADGDLLMLNVEKDRWRSLECLESGAVLYGSKDGESAVGGGGGDEVM